MKTVKLLKMMKYWPPFFGSGVKVAEVSDDLHHLRVEMKLRFWNKNYVGTQFGGSLYSMVDPFYMLMLMEHLGRDYIVWDKAATIRFRRPGRGTVHAVFKLTPERISEIREAADARVKTEPVFIVEVRDEQGEVVAQVEKTLYVAKKENKRPTV